MRRLVRLPICLLTLPLVGCPSSHPVPFDAGGSVPAIQDSGPPPPPELTVGLRIPDEDGGAQSALLKQGEPLFLAPVQSLKVQTNRTLRNYRIRVFDESDRALE